MAHLCMCASPVLFWDTYTAYGVPGTMHGCTELCPIGILRVLTDCSSAGSLHDSFFWTLQNRIDLERSMRGVSVCSERESKELGAIKSRSCTTARHTNMEEDMMS
jgi:hypothetical protein